MPNYKRKWYASRVRSSRGKKASHFKRAMQIWKAKFRRHEGSA